MSSLEPPSPEHLINRLRILALSSPPQTALFYARIWHALSQRGGAAHDSSLPALTCQVAAHEAVHVLALAFLATDEPYSALHLVRDTAEHFGPASAAAGAGAGTGAGLSSRHAVKGKPSVGCLGCATIVARACEAVGRYSEGAKVLERAMRQHPSADPQLPQMQQAPSDTTNLLLARMSHRSKETDIAAEQYIKALSDNVWLWEAYTALCDIGAAPLAEQTFPTPPTAVRASSTATLRANTYPGASMSQRGTPRDSNPFGASASTSASSSAISAEGARVRSPPAAPASVMAGSSRYPGRNALSGTHGAQGMHGLRGMQGQAQGRAPGGLMANMTPGTGYDDSMLGHGVGGSSAMGGGGMFTPEVGAVNGHAGGGVHGMGAGSRVQMLGGTLWDTPSSVGDTTFPSVQPMRRVLPPRTTTAPASSSAPALSTPSMGSALPSGPPAMKRARGTAHAPSGAGRAEYETPVGPNGPAHAGVGAGAGAAYPGAPGRAGGARAGTGREREEGMEMLADSQHAPTHAHAGIRRGQRDPKSIEQNSHLDSDAPRRSTRLKVPVPPVKPSLRLTKSSTKTLATDARVKGGTTLDRSRSATATSSASGLSKMTSPPLDSASAGGPFSTASSVVDQPTEAALQYAADVYLLSVVRVFALSYRALSTYDTLSAISHLDTLPPALQASPLALIVIAIAFYEQADYVRARRAFTSLFAIEPYRLQGVHLYSTLLWHLADVPALSALAQGAVAISKTRSEVWIAVGNCMSLGGDHEGALRCFKRATQVGGGAWVTGAASEQGQGLGSAVRPGMGGVDGEAAYGGGSRVTAYAYTLAGYEAVELEEYERAVRMYRLAIRTDGRLYNAWYGLGQAFMKMSKVSYAEHHFRRAVEINPGNPVLLCCIGQVLEAQEDNRASLQAYTRAALLPSSSSSSSSSSSTSPPPLVQFKRIRMLIALDQLPDALTLLEPLARDLPDEAQVQLLLGKCLMAVGRKAEGVQALTEARELAPRLAGKIARLVGGEEESEEEED